MEHFLNIYECFADEKSENTMNKKQLPLKWNIDYLIKNVFFASSYLFNILLSLQIRLRNSKQSVKGCSYHKCVL